MGVPQPEEMAVPAEGQVRMVPLPMEEVMVPMAMRVQARAESASTQPHENFPKPPENHTLEVVAAEIMPQLMATTVQVVLAAQLAEEMEAP